MSIQLHSHQNFRDTCISVSDKVLDISSLSYTKKSAISSKYSCTALLSDMQMANMSYRLLVRICSRKTESDEVLDNFEIYTRMILVIFVKHINQ